MFAKYKKLGVLVLGGALLAGLSSPWEVWARGGGGRAGGGGDRGGYGGDRGAYGGADRGYNAGDRGYNAGDRGYNAGDRGFNDGYRGNPSVDRANNFNNFNRDANAGFAARHFDAANNWNGNWNAGGNRLATDANIAAVDRAVGPYGSGYGGLGYGAAVNAGLGYGAGYPFFAMYGSGGYGGGYSSGGAYASTGQNYSDDDGYSTSPAVAWTNTAPNTNQITSAGQFDAQGEVDFKAGNYPAAVQDWQHALIDSPHNGGDMLLLAQGLFATGQYQPAAGAVQLAMQMLPQDQWGNVIKNYTELYSGNTAYTEQLRKLEAARTANPNDPALRFLLGYQYGYLGHAKPAIQEFDKGIALRPQDRGAVLMRNQFAEKASVAALPVPALPATASTPAAQPISISNPAS